MPQSQIEKINNKDLGLPRKEVKWWHLSSFQSHKYIKRQAIIIAANVDIKPVDDNQHRLSPCRTSTATRIAAMCQRRTHQLQEDHVISFIIIIVKIPIPGVSFYFINRHRGHRMAHVHRNQ